MTQTHDTIRKDSELGPIPQEWEESNIGEFGGLLPGYAFKSDDFGDTGIPIIKIKNISETGSVDLENTDKVQDHVLNEKTSKFLLSNGDFIVAMTGATIGKVGKIKSKGERILLNQRVGKFEIKDQSKLDKDFLYYNTQNKPFLDVINNIANGVAQANISGAQIESISIPLPPLHEQQAIASLLGSLDDKIEVLHEQNRTLEKMGQEIFKSWFVDFDFPGSNGFLIESEMGMIPKGWRVGKLGDFINYIVDNRGKTPNTSDIKQGSIPMIEVNSLVGDGRITNVALCKKYVSDEIYNTWFRKGHPQKGDVLISTVGSIGEISLVFDEQICIAQNIVALRSDNIGEFLYQLLDYYKSDIVSLDISTVQPSLKIPHLLNFEIIIPDRIIIDKFVEQVKIMSSKIYANYGEIQSLIQTRDSLLPRLMSGKIRVF